MVRPPDRRNDLWRRLISCLVAYAFVLQSGLVGVAAAQSAAMAADRDSPGIELCVHQDGTTGVPAGNPEADGHCKLCTLGGVPASLAPDAPPRLLVFEPAPASWPASEWLAPRLAEFSCVQARAPPSKA